MQHLTKDQMTDLLAAAKRVSDSLYAMILIGWRHGLRASEICSLTLADVDLAGGYITIQRLKGSLKTTQALFPDEKEILAKLAAGKQRTDWYFPGRFAGRHITRRAFFEQFEKVCASLGFAEHLRHPHVLKHSCGMVMIKRGIENARQYLGHKSISSTGAYLRVSDEQASREAMEAFA